MPILTRGINGVVKGKNKTSSFYVLKGQNIERARPAEVANPRTPLQTRNRVRLANLVGIFRVAAPAINAGFANRGQTLSRYNAFVSRNNPDVYTDGANPERVPLASMVVSTGTLSGVENVVATTSGNATVTWDTSNILTGDSASDELIVCGIGCDDVGLWDADDPQFELLATNATRGVSGTYTTVFDPTKFDENDQICVFAFFASTGRDRSSDSVARLSEL